MIGIVLAMIRARRAQAVTLFLLAVVAVAAAVAGPVSTRATDAAVVRLEVANAIERERSIAVIAFSDPADPTAASRLDEVAELLRLPGFEVVRSGELQTVGPVADPAELMQVGPTRLISREGVCRHVTVVAGRCLAGPLEILVGERTAAREGLTPGTSVTVMAARYDEEGTLQSDGAPATVTVVGVYRPTDYADPYWAGQTYFRIGVDGTRGEVVFTNVPTMALVPHTRGSSFIDVLAPDEALTADRLAGIEAELQQALLPVRALPNVIATTDLPELARRVAASRELAGQLGPVAFIPLAGISLFVIYLAVGYGAFSRRSEAGLIALRGLSRPRRWWLASGETLLPILAGAPVGYVLGHLGVGLVASVRLGSAEGAQLSAESLPYAAIALASALVLALLGQWRALREPVVELLRGVPRATPAWRSLAVEVLVVALAVVVTVQQRLSRDGISGLGLLVPALLVVAVALLAARANVALTGLVAKLALRRGLLGAGLSAVQLARRPGSQRLFVLLCVGTAMLAFVAAGTDVAARAREDRAAVVTGAPRVLQVAGANSRELLAATHELDPDGAWAMAVTVLPPPATGGPTVLAVDSSRLAAVAAWRPEFGADPAAVARVVAVPGPGDPGYLAPVEFQGTELQIELQVLTDFSSGPPPRPLNLDLELLRLASNSAQRVSLRGLEVGSHTLHATAVGCEQGCRLLGFTVMDAQASVRLHLGSIRAPQELLTPELLGDRDRWRSSEVGVVSPGPGGVTVRKRPREFTSETIRVTLLNAPVPVPVVSTVPLPEAAEINSLDFRTVDATSALPVSMLPRVGSQGVLADLRYLEFTVLDPPGRDAAEIWLGPLAPADAARQFRDLGLQVIDESTIDSARAVLDREGPALALQFHLAAAAFGVLLALGGLGLVAAVDRRARAADLRALRVQGLRRRMARRAALWGYLSIVVLAAVTGLAGAALAWAAAGDRIPIFIDATSVLQPPRWPHWLAVAGPWAVATGAMALAAVLASWALRAAIARGNGNGGAR